MPFPSHDRFLRLRIHLLDADIRLDPTILHGDRLAVSRNKRDRFCHLIAIGSRDLLHDVFVALHQMWILCGVSPETHSSTTMPLVFSIT